MKVSTQEWLKVKEVARILSKSQTSVSDRFGVLVGKDPGVIDFGCGKKRDLRISRQFLDKWMYADHRGCRE